MLTIIIYKDGFVKDVVKLDPSTNGVGGIKFSSQKKYIENFIKENFDDKVTYKILDEHEEVRNIMGW